MRDTLRSLRIVSIIDTNTTTTLVLLDSDINSFITHMRTMLDTIYSSNHDVITSYFPTCAVRCSQLHHHRQQQEACNCLANLCVMNLYTTTSPICNYFLSLLQDSNGGIGKTILLILIVYGSCRIFRLTILIH